MQASSQQKQRFLEELWSYYGQYGRHDLPWRIAEPGGVFNPYKIFVSEVMLQQTQVSRVIEKYNEFLQTFATVDVLADAGLGDVLRAWQGLGYNRRAKYLRDSAKIVRRRGSFPMKLDELTDLPGIGTNTAGAIMAYAFNSPTIFVETNVRTVYIHHFFANESAVRDAEITKLLQETIDQEQPREFYWALMDYGSYLKKQIRNTSQSAHYTKQSKFEGSNRQIRGMVLRELSSGTKSMLELARQIDDQRLTSIVEDLVAERMINKKGNSIRLS
jgi:A/G-specific adenine glycosylase